jgi:hypothetical protein
LRREFLDILAQSTLSESRSATLDKPERDYTLQKLKGSAPIEA